MTIATNNRLTAGGADIVPRQAATMGMKQILEAKKMLLLACFPEQAVPLKAIRDGKLGPDLPASYLSEAADSEIVWTKDVIDL
jgi:glucosamine-6-phosphate deaminase